MINCLLFVWMGLIVEGLVAVSKANYNNKYLGCLKTRKKLGIFGWSFVHLVE